ncbi:MAG: hypothetical protein K940chlam2_00411 [Chlamydiae bacterium]|nr:hypothetical protein [Chlamydiota bacterium]
MRRFLVLLLSALSISLIAQDECAPCISICECDPGPCLGNSSLRHRFPGGIGYARGYSSIDLFYAAQVDANWFPYFDVRGHVFNDGKPAFNLGTGFRYLCVESEQLLGLNFFWDYGDARHTTFHQIGLGAEFLWPYWDLHLNSYIPISKTKKGYRTGLHKFQGNQAIVYKKFETAMSGIDLTIGKTLFDCNCFELRALLKGYYLRGDFKEDAGGFQFTLRSNLFEWITAEGSISYDNQFKLIGQGELALNFSFGGSIKRCERKTGCCPAYVALEEQLMRKTERFEIIATTTKKKKTTARSLNTGEELHFLFVNNTSGSQGTFEDPFGSLADAAAVSNPGDVFYIFPGDGTAMGLDTPITLQNNQLLIGSAAPLLVRGRRFGAIEIPRQTDSFPFLQPAGGINFITVAHGNTISGLNIAASGGQQRLIFSNNASNIKILNNHINGALSSNDAIGLTGTFNEKLMVLGNHLTPPDVGGAKAIRFDPSSGISRSLFSLNSFMRSASGNPGSGEGIACFPGATAFCNVIIEHNLLITGDDCVDIQMSQPGAFAGLVRNNNATIQSAGAIPACYRISFPNNGSIEAIVLGNQASVIGNGSQFVTSGDLNPNGSMKLKVFKNQANTPAVTGFDFDNTGGQLFAFESPNLRSTGVEAINTGSFTFTPDPTSFTFIPFE